MSKSIKILINYGLSSLLFLWLMWGSYQQLLQQHDLKQQWHFLLDTIKGEYSWKIYLVIVLVFMNWAIEAIKWQQIISTLQKLSFAKAFKATLAGVAFAINTPNRIGEYGARVLFLEEGKRVKAIPLTIVSSLSQLAVTMLAGIISFFLMYEKLSQSFIWIQKFSTKGFAFTLILLLTMGILVLYFKIAWVTELILRIPHVKKISQYLNEVKQLSGRVLWVSFVLSVCRYAVFISQYIMLLQVMHVDIPFGDAIGVISILFLFLTLLPTVALLELGIRWELGLILFGMYSHNVLGIYIVASTVWVLNLLIPSIIGSLSILRIRIFKLKE